ncbi:MAG: glutamyl-tRNA reductase [Candidatus Sericytochromatia bacterium]|nr:glutamyl-tRNA reductase [Candidatus Sericytochromatia bacterium]
MQLVVTGMSHRTAPVAVREQASIGADALGALSPVLMSGGTVLEALVLSTCNRIECYAIVEDVDQAVSHLQQALCDASGIAPELVTQYGYTYFNKRATQHLYRVAAGLDSMVLGEGEILSQIKQALASAQANNTTKTVLHALFQFAIEAGKRVRTETAISHGSVSMGSVAADRLAEVIPDFANAHVMVLGAGQIAAATARRLRSCGVGRMTIANRRPERAVDLGGELHADVTDLATARLMVGDVQAIVVGTAAPFFVLGLDDLTTGQALHVVDLGVPRQVDPRVTDLAGITLIDVDILRSQVHENETLRASFTVAAEAILDEELLKCISWFNTLGLTPLIGSLYALFDEIRQTEIERASRKKPISEAELQVIEHVTKAIIQKILHHPIVQLKVEPDAGKRQVYAEALSALFNLEAPTFESRYVHRRPSDAPVHA